MIWMEDGSGGDVEGERGLIRSSTLNAYQVAHAISVSGFNGFNEPSRDIVNFSYNGHKFIVNFERLVSTLGILPEKFRASYQQDGGQWKGFKPGGKQGLANLLGKTIEFRDNDSGSSETYVPQ